MSFGAEPSPKPHLLGTAANTSILAIANTKNLLLVEEQSRLESCHQAHKQYLISAQFHDFLGLLSCNTLSIKHH